jgi:hypothetical protein
MGGFLPLLEAFVAFALTMAALTTVVSALVGTWNKLTRARAYGLRMQVVYFYRNELGPTVRRLGAAAGAGKALAALDASFAGRDEASTRRLAQFLVDATLLPQVVDFAGRAVSGDARVTMLRNGIKQPLWQVTGPDGFTRKPMDPVQRFYRWRSLRFALDALPVEEFKIRLAASEIGRDLRAALQDDALFDATVDDLTRRFAALGNAASENFRRRAHVASYVAAFALAFGANIDTFNLLSTYMSKPELTRRLIADFERDAALPGVEADRGAARALLPDPPRLDAVRAQLKAAVDDPRLGALDAQLQKELQGRLAAVDGALGELRESAVEATALIVGAGNAFPIGWNLYPNCGRTSADPRCLALAKDRPSGVLDTRARDPGGFYRWLIGVLVTVFLLGLGTPFWVQVINGALYARNLLRGANSTGTGAPPAAPPAVPPVAPAVRTPPG